jgi:hypothetical protein
MHPHRCIHNVIGKGVVMARIFFQFLFVLAVTSSAVFGQVAITGQIRGVATDANGGVLPNVTISARVQL